MRLHGLLLSAFIGAYVWLSAFYLFAAEHHGQVKFNGLPVPGAIVTATQGDKKLVAVTDPQGAYSFPDLAEGTWAMQVEMLGFAPLKQNVTVTAGSAGPDWELKMLALSEINAQAQAVTPPPSPAQISIAAPPATAPRAANSKNGKNAPLPPANTPGGFQRAQVNASAGGTAAATESAPAASDAAPPGPDAAELSQRAQDGFLINGSQVNGASSPFALNQAFGNNRRGPRSLYNGNLGLVVDHSALDARQYSITGQDTPKPDSSKYTLLGSYGGPLKIPHLFRNGPTFVVNFQVSRARTGTTQPALVPTAAERTGDFSQAVTRLGQPVQITDPAGQFQGNIIPGGRINPQAAALLNLYPLPNFTGNSAYNYQIPIVSNAHTDGVQTRLNRAVGRKNQLSGSFGLQSVRGDNPNIFGFLDTNRTLGLNINVTWRHTFTPRFYGTFGYTFSRQSTQSIPFFQNRMNVSGLAGITGNNQEPVNWGPPGLSFAGSGIQALYDGNPSSNHNQTGELSYNMIWNHGRHNVQFGADTRTFQFNYLSQNNPRGTFTFTGAASGYDFADFLLGIPDASAIAFGNADKYFRTRGYDAYFTDDWRMSPGFTLNAGVRWEYGAPITELYGRLVNLDIAPGFTAVAPVVANHPIGPLTGMHYSDSLVNPDKHAFQPRIGISWRPISGSSMVVRAGYGVYYNSSVYQSIATQMDQQSPLSKSLSVQNNPLDQLTLANGFNASPNITANTFAVDPNLRVGYAQNWQISVQRDLPASLQMTASYLGIKGTRGEQEFLPNTYPIGAVNPCPTCPKGFYYLTSNGNSTRNSGTIQLRRRLHNGFTATLQYTYAKAIDDSSLSGQAGGGALIAQNWLNLSAERGLSTFDQRHLVNLNLQYTTGMGVRGGMLLSGWRGRLLKDWTIVSQITAGTGMPLTPLYSAVVAGTGVSGPIRPNYTGISVYDAPPGRSLNPAAYAPPTPGEWGNAGRNSITGPSRFTMSGSMARTFRLSDRYTIDLRFDSTNPINHVTFPSWNTNITSSQFGLPGSANPMRNLQTTVRVRF